MIRTAFLLAALAIASSSNAYAMTVDVMQAKNGQQFVHAEMAQGRAEHHRRHHDRQQDRVDARERPGLPGEERNEDQQRPVRDVDDVHDAEHERQAGRDQE